MPRDKQEPCQAYFVGRVAAALDAESVSGHSTHEIAACRQEQDMKDDRGLYYHPDPSNHKIRVYVREGAGGIEFRLWRSEHPEVWEQHEWLPYAVVSAAATMYKERGTGADPLALYDLNVAQALIRGEALKAPRRQRGK